MKSPLPLFAAVLLAGCAGLTTYNDGERVVIEHDAFITAEAAREQAAKSCRQAGKTGASFLTTVSKNPAIPVGSGVQISTFRCV